MSDTEFVSYDVECISPPAKVVVSMYQQPGAVCDPVVKAGTHVKKGQVIGSCPGSVAAPVHAPVSGTVSAVGNSLEPTGRIALAVTIESDGKEEWVPSVTSGGAIPSMIGVNRLAAALKNAGIVEAGTPSFPLFTQILAPRGESAEEPAPKRADMLIINGVDIEPGVMVRRAVIHTFTDQLIEGIKLLQLASGVRKTVLAVGEEDELSAELLRTLKRADIEIFRAAAKYPSGMTPILVKQITGKEIPLPNGTPRDVGLLVFDVISALNVLDAIRDGKPQVEKLITVLTPDMEKPKNVVVPIGTTVADIAQALGLSTEAGKVLMGGPMMGEAQFSLEVPVTKQSYALFFQDKTKVVEFKSEPCIDCGACVKCCPTNLMPNLLGRYCEYNRFGDAERHHIFHCIECGNCAYVCPTKRPMVHFMRFGKKELLSKRTGA